LNGLSEEDERKVIRETIQTITKTVGKAPEGWLGPALAETFVTPDLLAEEGFGIFAIGATMTSPIR
jgi:hypothetical protein